MHSRSEVGAGSPWGTRLEEQWPQVDRIPWEITPEVWNDL
jgi:hypothetical protein